MNNVVFLTGATGLIGGNLAVKILRQYPHQRLIILVRGSSPAAAEERFWGTLRIIDPTLHPEQYRERVRVVRGDIDSENLGLTPEDFSLILDSATHIIHSAASVKFHLPLAEVRAINVRGTANVLALAQNAYRNGRLRKFGYISTAYVSGKRGGLVLESELEHSAGFANTYEQSKYETESLVRDHAKKLPTIIFRPSIVVGDSQTGITTTFNVLYVPLRLIIQGIINTLPGSPTVPLDVVPVDFVRDAICHIMFASRSSVGKTFHLTAGTEKTSGTGEIIGLVGDWFRQSMKRGAGERVRFVSREEFYGSVQARRGGAVMMRLMAAYESYLCIHRTFDTTNLRAALQGSGIQVPRFGEYCHAIMDYFVRALAARELKRAA